MNILSAAWAFVKGLFTKKTASIIWQILLSNTKTVIMKKLSDKVLQQKAYDFAKELVDVDLTGEEKKALFDKKMKEFVKGTGMEIGSSVLNALRELAVASIKVEAELK